MRSLKQLIEDSKELPEGAPMTVTRGENVLILHAIENLPGVPHSVIFNGHKIEISEQEGMVQ